MSEIVTDDCADTAASFTLTAVKSGEPETQSTLAVEKDHRQQAIKSLLPLPITRLMTSLQQSKPRIMWIKTGFKAPFVA